MRIRPIAHVLMILVCLAVSSVAAAQEPISLRTARPPEGSPGQALTVTLEGAGFAGATEVRVAIGDLAVQSVRVISDQVVEVDLAIPDGVAPGPRTIELTGFFGPNEVVTALLENGFQVLARPEPFPAPAEPGQLPDKPDDAGQGWSWWPWILIPLGLVAMAGGAALAVGLRQRAQRADWQREAQDGELPRTCQAGSHLVRRESVELAPGRWKIAGLEVTLYEGAAGRRGNTHPAPRDLVDRLDRAARQRLLPGNQEAWLRQIDAFGRELASLALGWQAESQAGRDLYLQARLEGGEASADFARYRCVGASGVWQKTETWTARLQAVDHLPLALRGPDPDEDRVAYRAALEQRLVDYVASLIQEAGRLI